MKMEELLSNRSDSENVIYDFSDLSLDELKTFVHSRMFGEESLSDAEMKLLESGTAKIKTKSGKPRKYKPLPPQQPGETAAEWLHRVVAKGLR